MVAPPPNVIYSEVARPPHSNRLLATRLCSKAAELAIAGKSRVMVALRGTDIVAVPLDDACSEIRGVDPGPYEVATTFFG